MPQAPSHALEERHRKVRRAMGEHSVDALVVTALPNILYLTNFAGSSAIVVLTRDSVEFITDFRYVTSINDSRGTASECPGLNLVTIDSSYDLALAGVIDSLGTSRVGFEAAHLPVNRYNW